MHKEQNPQVNVLQCKVSAYIYINTNPPLCAVLQQPNDPQPVIVGWKYISFAVVVPSRASINLQGICFVKQELQA